MAGVGEAAALIGAFATVAQVATASKGTPTAPKPVAMPVAAKAPDTNAITQQQAQQRAAALGRQSTIRTSPLGIVGNGAPAAGAGTSTSLGGGY